MKKLLSMVLTLSLMLTLAACLGGCKKEVKPLRILIDVAGSLDFDEGTIDSWYKSFKERLEKAGGPTDIEFEKIPLNGAERASALTRIRTEVMAGQGPDVFILCQVAEQDASKDYLALDNSSLFLCPEKIMHNGLLMPLDKYLEKAQFMEWDKLTPAVMAAGYDEEYGQVILPMTYTFPVTYYRAEDLPKAPEAYTWADMVQSDDPVLRDSAAGVFRGLYSLMINSVMLTDRRLADYKERKLIFSQEELLDRTQELEGLMREQLDRWDEAVESGTEGAAAQYFQNWMEVHFESINGRVGVAVEQGRWSKPYIEGMIWSEPAGPLTMGPAYSPEGGITAKVYGYTAINANTKRPDDAFFVVDFLLSYDEQKSSGLYMWMYETNAIPVHEDLMNEDNTVGSMTMTGGWSMSPENYAEFSRLRDQITAVRFYDTLEIELETLCSRIQYSIENHEEIDLETLVEQTYMRMRQEVSE